MPKLCVNIDHIATLREARKEKNPDPVEGAMICKRLGVDGITFHLREDRRHIQDKDLVRLRKCIKIKLNMEMAAISEMVKIAKKTRVDQVTLVPEKRKEITTEGGLDVFGHRNRMKKVIRDLKSARIFVSLFIEPALNQVKSSAEAGADAVELHTGEYCQAKAGKKKRALGKIKKAAAFAYSLGLKVFAGHGLDYNNVNDIASISEIEELNIGHSIIARAVFSGLEVAVREMLEAIK